MPTTPAATAAAEPPDDPPAVRPWRHGLCAGPFTRFPDSPFQPYSDVVVLPTMTAPAARMRATSGESAPAISPRWTSDPMLVGTPATSTRSLIAIGMPAERAGRLGGVGALRLLSLPEGEVRSPGHERVQPRVERLDPLERLARDLDR